MTLPVSGAISFNAINVELGVAGTTQANINQASYRTLAGVPSGQISLSNFYGKSNRVSASATISANTANYTLNTAKAPGYVAGVTDMILTINSGVFVSSSSTGTAALIVNTSWAAGDTVRINNGGTIVGRGGNGGAGRSNAPSTADAGGGGGLALQVQRAITMNNTNRIAGGGGGGGGGGTGQYINIASSGGGGGGIGGSTGAAGGFGAGTGANGTLTSAGGGGAGQDNPYNPGGKLPNVPIQGGAGGAGGGYGSGGSSGSGGSPPSGAAGGGGAAGGCITGNSFITYVATGTRNGSIS